MEKVRIFNAPLELRRLEDKVADSKEERICPSWLLVPKSACKEAGWDPKYVEEAIERGEARKEGKEIASEASWEDLDQEEEYASLTTHEDAENLGLLSKSSEILRGEVTEEEQKEPGRVFNLLGDLGEEESGEEEKVREEQPEVTFLSISRPQDFEQLWDCPMCDDILHVSVFKCPHCGFDREYVEQAVMEFYMIKDNSEYTPKKHVAYLNGLIMLKTGNPNWHKLVIGYMEEYNLKPEDMVGLFGPKPWEEAIMGNEAHEVVEPHEKQATNAELTTALQEQKGTELEDPLASLGKSLRTKAELKAEATEATEADIKSAFEEKVAEIADSDPRTRVIVSDEVGWLCEDCNRVWSLELKYCTVCNKEYAAEVEKKEEDTAEKNKGDIEVLKDKLNALGTTVEAKDDSLYGEVKDMDGMKTAEKAKLMLLLKDKEKVPENTDDIKETQVTPIL